MNLQVSYESVFSVRSFITSFVYLQTMVANSG